MVWPFPGSKVSGDGALPDGALEPPTELSEVGLRKIVTNSSPGRWQLPLFDRYEADRRGERNADVIGVGS